MRVSLPVSPTLSTKTTKEQSLHELVAQGQRVMGLVRRVTPTSLYLFTKQGELELPLEQKSDLVEGQLVELTRQDEMFIAIRLVQPSISPEAAQQPLEVKALTQVLLDLDIPPTQEAVLVAQALLERGFSLQESLIWHLLPWAEQGQLDWAMMLLEAKYPVEPRLLALAKQLQDQDAGQVLLARAREEIPLDLQELLQYPTFESRFKWSSRFTEGETFKALVRLLVKERLAESLLSQSKGLGEFVFALPFLQEDELYASWVRIQRDTGATGDGEGQAGFCVELEIPTKTLGVVGARLAVRGNDLAIIIKVMEHEDILVDSLESLEQELMASGWNLKKLQVRSWENAQSSRPPL